METTSQLRSQVGILENPPFTKHPGPQSLPSQNWPREHTPISAAWRGNNGRGARERARRPGRPNSTAPARPRNRARRPLPGRPRPPPPSSGGAAHLRSRGQRAALTKQGQGHCKGARQPLAAARRSTRSSQAHPRSRHRPAALTPRRGVAGTPARGEAAGRDAGGRCKKKLCTRYCQAHRARGDPLALGEPALVAAICARRGARTGRGTCQAGRLG